MGKDFLLIMQSVCTRRKKVTAAECGAATGDGLSGGAAHGAEELGAGGGRHRNAGQTGRAPCLGRGL